jgi:homoserine dehydrogenase
MADRLKLGLAGIGTVGGGLLRLLEAREAVLDARASRPIEVVAVSARSRRKKRSVDLSGVRFVADPVALATDPEIDVFVELIGGEEGVAKDAVEAALRAGKHVVTANKALLAHHGAALAALAEKHGAALNFEAAVAGGIPVVKVIREGLQGNDITRVYGILNGTCNYILTRMERDGRSFADVLKEAQEQGYAEADPTFDIGGFDTAHKLALLTSLAFSTRTKFDAVYVEGIETITPADIEAADDLGYRIKLLGVALRTDSGIEQRVHPTMVPKDTAIANVDGVSNCVAIDGDYVGRTRRRKCAPMKVATTSGFRSTTVPARSPRSRSAWPRMGFRWRASSSAARRPTRAAKDGVAETKPPWSWSPMRRRRPQCVTHWPPSSGTAMWMPSRR